MQKLRTKIFEQTKPDYQKTPKKCVYKAKSQHTRPNLQQNNTRRRTREIIWLNTPFSFKVETKVAKIFLKLRDTNLSPADNLHKIFNCNTVKVSYSCAQKHIRNYKTT